MTRSLLPTRLNQANRKSSTKTITITKGNARILRTSFLIPPRFNSRCAPIAGKRLKLRLTAHSTITVSVVRRLPRYPKPGEHYLLYNDTRRKDVIMHNLVRFPAKVHPPLVSWALSRFTKTGHTILDPFCGCGTVVLEATLRGRRAIGFDIDPYAAFMAQVKTRPPYREEFFQLVTKLNKKLRPMERPLRTYKRLAKGDISESYFRDSQKKVSLPPIPGINHWFKRYVLIDLARIWRVLINEPSNSPVNQFLLISFASILRLCSNADPDTLSGIEVTKRMRKWLERGRYVNPFQLFANRIDRNIRIIENFWRRFRRTEHVARARVYTGSALLKRSYRIKKESVRLILTSPPYCSAVEYDRRHKLEHYWLGFLANKDDASKLRRHYVGRRNYVYGRAEELAQKLPESVRAELLRILENILHKENQRARAIVQYFLDMAKWLEIASDYLEKGGHLVLVVGDSTVRGTPIPTSRLLMRMAPPELRRQNSFSYVLRNRSMQYSRWNQANVATENVLVFVKKPSPKRPGEIQLFRTG